MKKKNQEEVVTNNETKAIIYRPIRNQNNTQNLNNQPKIRGIKEPSMNDNYNSGSTCAENNNKLHRTRYSQRLKSEKG